MKISKTVKHLSIALSAAALASCASNSPKTASPEYNIPDWILNPVIENGIADTQCVIAHSGYNMSILKTKATALARAELAKQISVKVKAMDKTFQRLTESSNGPSQGGTFESVSKQVSNQTMSGSRVIKQNYVNLPPDNKSNYCVMVGLSPEQSKAMFAQLVQQSKTTNLSPRDEAVLYERFLAEKAQKELEEFAGNN